MSSIDGLIDIQQFQYLQTSVSRIMRCQSSAGVCDASSEHQAHAPAGGPAERRFQILLSQRAVPVDGSRNALARGACGVALERRHQSRRYAVGALAGLARELGVFFSLLGAMISCLAFWH